MRGLIRGWAECPVKRHRKVGRRGPTRLLRRSRRDRLRVTCGNDDGRTIMANGIILSRRGLSVMPACALVSVVLIANVRPALAADRVVLAENGTGTW